MKKKIDIIMPHYKENKETIMTALSSINCQTGIDFSRVNVTVVTDGIENKLDFSNDKFNFKFNNLIKDEEYHSAGTTRQYGVDRTDNDFILFLDSDDILASSFALKFFFDEIEKDPDLEIIFSGYLEEKLCDDNSFRYLTMNECISSGCLHGKLYNRKFLLEHNIRFTKLQIGEDGSFNFRALCHCTKAIFKDNIFTYVYKYNPKSITRENGILMGFDINIKSFADSCFAWEEFFNEIVNNKQSIINSKLIKMFLDAQMCRLNSIKEIGGFSEIQINEIKRCENNLNNLYEKFKNFL